MPKTSDLLEEIAALKAMLIAAEARDRRKDERIERLEKLVAAFKQVVFGRNSEKSDPDPFQLALEDLEATMAVIDAEEDAEDRAAKRRAKPRAANRGSRPKHLPRIEEVIEPDSLICACGGCLHCIGEVEEGRAAFELRPVHDALMADLKRSSKLFMDETRAPVLDPGARKTKTGYFWALARDDRPWGGTSPPSVVFPYAPVGEGSMPSGSCRASVASCRSMAMPDTTA